MPRCRPALGLFAAQKPGQLRSPSSTLAQRAPMDPIAQEPPSKLRRVRWHPPKVSHGSIGSNRGGLGAPSSAVQSHRTPTPTRMCVPCVRDGGLSLAVPASQETRPFFPRILPPPFALGPAWDDITATRCRAPGRHRGPIHAIAQTQGRTGVLEARPRSFGTTESTPAHASCWLNIDTRPIISTMVTANAGHSWSRRPSRPRPTASEGTRPPSVPTPDFRLYLEREAVFRSFSAWSSFSSPP